MTTFHLVETQDDSPEHVHSIILTEEEARSQLGDERPAHSFGGWKVQPVLDADGRLSAVIATRGDRRRAISFREFEHPVPGAVFPHEC